MKMERGDGNGREAARPRENGGVFSVVCTIWNHLCENRLEHVQVRVASAVPTAVPCIAQTPLLRFVVDLIHNKSTTCGFVVDLLYVLLL